MIFSVVLLCLAVAASTATGDEGVPVQSGAYLQDFNHRALVSDGYYYYPVQQYQQYPQQYPQFRQFGPWMNPSDGSLQSLNQRSYPDVLRELSDPDSRTLLLSLIINPTGVVAFLDANNLNSFGNYKLATQVVTRPLLGEITVATLVPKK